MTNEVFLIRGARIEGGEAADLVIQDGVIADRGLHLSRAGATVVDADGLIFVRWVLGTTEIDSYLRSTDPDRLVAALTPLAPDPTDTEAAA